MSNEIQIVEEAPSTFVRRDSNENYMVREKFEQIQRADLDRHERLVLDQVDRLALIHMILSDWVNDRIKEEV